jgi:hypothetical protein
VPTRMLNRNQLLSCGLLGRSCQQQRYTLFGTGVNVLCCAPVQFCSSGSCGSGHSLRRSLEEHSVESSRMNRALAFRVQQSKYECPRRG